ncbi:protein D1-like [Planococcus citri]|uniref:protein D1-like n=1 Tax=Planococcus citri TaxID=170843 RepID=UPI0031F9169A
MSPLFVINVFSSFVYSLAVWTVPTNPIAEFFNSTVDFEDLSFSGVTTHFPFNFRCRSYVAKAFKYFQVHPDIIAVAPNDFVNITFPSGAEVSIGEKLLRSQVKEQPSKVVWNTDPSVPYYSLVMQNPDDQEFRKQSQSWLVINIPGCDIDKGDTVLRYMEPCPPPTRDPMRISFMVFAQPEKISLDDIGYSEERNWWFEANDFRYTHNLSWPVAGNLYLLDD